MQVQFTLSLGSVNSVPFLYRSWGWEIVIQYGDRPEQHVFLPSASYARRADGAQSLSLAAGTLTKNFFWR